MIPIQNSAVSSASTASSGAAAASRRSSAAAGAGGPGVANASASVAASAEQVSISNAGQMLQMASTQGATPPASDARIAALQAAIQSGQYVVDPQRISSGLLQDSQALLGASTPVGKP
ncbi:MAG: flagellar biosynthesis anti-sigma factor FlgM [Thiomonas sp.]|nr:flagellar biosynthesis anti-sigma factor FlgM [Thiomonas sp.]